MFFPRPRRYRNPDQSMQFSVGNQTAGDDGNKFTPGDYGNVVDAPAWWIDGAQITNSAITIACWSYHYSFAVQDLRFVSRQASSAEDNHAFMLGMRASGSLRNLRTRVSGSITSGTVLGDTDLVGRTNEWIHAACVYDRSETIILALYLDGVLDNVGGDGQTDLGNLIQIANAEVFIGNDGGDADNSPDACLAHAVIWKRPLTAAEIVMLAKGRCPSELHPQDILMYYSLNSGWSMGHDLASNRHDDVVKRGGGIRIPAGKYHLATNGPRKPPVGLAPPVMRPSADFLPWQFISTPEEGVQPTVGDLSLVGVQPAVQLEGGAPDDQPAIFFRRPMFP